MQCVEACAQCVEAGMWLSRDFTPNERETERSWKCATVHSRTCFLRDWFCPRILHVSLDALILRLPSFLCQEQLQKELHITGYQSVGLSFRSPSGTGSGTTCIPTMGCQTTHDGIWEARCFYFKPKCHEQFESKVLCLYLVFIWYFVVSKWHNHLSNDGSGGQSFPLFHHPPLLPFALFMS